MEKIWRKWKIYQSRMALLAADFFVFLIFWGGMLRKSFNADTIFHMVVEDADIWTNVMAGRYVTALGDFLLLKMGVRTTTYLSITMLISFIIFTFALYELQKLFIKWSPEDKISRIGYLCGISLVFLNVLFVEILMFSECCLYFAIGYLVAVLGVKCYVRKKYLLMFLAFGVAVSSYQYTMIFAAIVIAFYLCMEQKQKLSWNIVWREIIGIVCCLGIGALNLGSMYLLKMTNLFRELDKNAGIGNLGKKISKAGESLVELYRSSADIMPKLWLPFLFSLAIWGIIIYGCIKNRRTRELLFIVLVWLGSHLLLYVIPFANIKFYFPPRMSFCFYLIQGLLATVAFNVSYKPMRGLLTAGCVVYLFVQFLFADFTITNHFISNTLDEVYVNMVYQEILKYEEETGIRVEKLAVENDEFAPTYYEEVNYASHQINERAVGQVTSSLVLVVTGRYFEWVDIEDEVYEYYFEGKDWDSFNLAEQLVIIGDTAYWCIY